MAAVLLDTNAISDIMRGDPQFLTRLSQQSDLISTSAIVAGEIYYGLNRMPAGKKRAELELRASNVLGALLIEPITEQFATTYGQLKANLEIQGLNLDENDLWIAATAISQSRLLITRDQMLTRIPGLQLADWTK